MPQLYTIHDIVADTLVGAIIQEPADASALRAFHDALGAPNSILGQHPADFELLCLGTITNNGTITVPSTGPYIVGTGAQWAAITSTLQDKTNA